MLRKLVSIYEVGVASLQIQRTFKNKTINRFIIHIDELIKHELWLKDATEEDSNSIEHSEDDKMDQE